jgi:hypothetical protein
MKAPFKPSIFGQGQYQKHVVLDANCGLVCECLTKQDAQKIANMLNALNLIATAYVNAYTENELKQIAKDAINF